MDTDRIKDLEKLIEEKNFIKLKDEMANLNEVDIAELFEPLDKHHTLLVFRMLPKSLAVEVFTYLTKEQQSSLVESITDEELEDIVDELFLDDVVDIIEEMPATVVSKILEIADPNKRNLINKFLKYPTDSAGTIMTIEYVSLKKNMTVGEALDYIKKIGLDKETVYTCYVTDKNRKLEGIISLRKLVISDSNAMIEDIMDKDIIYTHTLEDREDVVEIFKRYSFMALPVVDNEERLTGIITFDDIMDVMDQEATEDFQKMAGMAPSEEKYLDTPIFQLAKHRIVWLLVLMISATFTQRIIGGYEEVLQSVVILTAFIPMLMDTGGNSGSQSSTLVIRGLALGEIKPKDIGQVVWKEFRVSIVVGVILAAVNFVRILVFEKVGYKVSLAVSITLFITVLIAKVVGSILPIVADKLKLDPAIMASPLITTIVDALSLIVYFKISTMLLGIA